jgi:hypothetical protein
MKRLVNSQMNDIIGQWSTYWFYHDPADEVLVFLPDGKGVFEYYWWRLSHYETFTYRVDGKTLSAIGDKTFNYDFDQNAIKESPSTLRFSGKFWVREANLEEAKLGCEAILELDKALKEMFPATNKFGRNSIHRDISNYKLPVFNEERSGNKQIIKKL